MPTQIHKKKFFEVVPALQRNSDSWAERIRSASSFYIIVQPYGKILE